MHSLHEEILFVPALDQYFNDQQKAANKEPGPKDATENEDSEKSVSTKADILEDNLPVREGGVDYERQC